MFDKVSVNFTGGFSPTIIVNLRLEPFEGNITSTEESTPLINTETRSLEELIRDWIRKRLAP